MLLISPLPLCGNKGPCNLGLRFGSVADYRFKQGAGTMAGSLSRTTLTLFTMMFILMCGSETAPARDNNPELQRVLKKLEGATSVTLMIIPWDISFRYRV